MSTIAGNEENKNGVDQPAVEEQTNGVGSQVEVDQEQQNRETAAKTPPLSPTSVTTVAGNTTQAKEKPRTKTKQNSTQISGNGGTQPSKSKVKRFSTTVISKLKKLGTREEQRHDNDLNRPHEDVEMQGKDHHPIDSQTRPEQEEKVPDQHCTIDLSQNSEDLPTAQHNVNQPTDLLSITTQVEENAKQQQDQDQEDFVCIETPGNDTAGSGPEKRVTEPENVSKHEMELASLKKLVAEISRKHDIELASLRELVAENTRKHGMEIASLKELVAESTRKHKTSRKESVAGNIETIASQNEPGSTPNDKAREANPVLTEDELTTSPIQERPGEGLVFRKADSISLTEVANLVRELNAQIDQAASLIIDLLLSRESSSSGKDSGFAWDELHDYLGSWLSNKLQRGSQEPEIDDTVAHIALQAGLIHACNRIINDWNPPFWAESLAFSRVYDKMKRCEDPITADTWRALTRNYMGSHDDQLEANKEYLQEVLLKLIVAVSGSPQSGETLREQCNDKVDDIARKAIDIHQVISQEMRSTDLSIFTIESGADFDQSLMEDTERSSGSTSSSKVACTVEMGLLSRKRASSKQPNGDGKVGGITLKAKVVLLDTLGEV